MSEYIIEPICPKCQAKVKVRVKKVEYLLQEIQDLKKENRRLRNLIDNPNRFNSNNPDFTSGDNGVDYLKSIFGIKD